MILKNRFSKKVQKIYIRCLSPPPKFEKILVIWGGLRQRVLRKLFVIVPTKLKKFWSFAFAFSFLIIFF